MVNFFRWLCNNCLHSRSTKRHQIFLLLFCAFLLHSTYDILSMEGVVYVERQLIKKMENQVTEFKNKILGKAAPSCILPSMPVKIFKPVENLMKIKRCLQNSSVTASIGTRAKSCLQSVRMKEFEPEIDVLRFQTEQMGNMGTEVHWFIPFRGGAVDMYFFKDIKPNMNLDMAQAVDYSRPTHPTTVPPCRLVVYGHGFVESWNQKSMSQYNRCKIVDIEVNNKTKGTENLSGTLLKVGLDGMDNLTVTETISKALISVTPNRFIHFAAFLGDNIIGDVFESVIKQDPPIVMCQISISTNGNYKKLMKTMITLDYVPVLATQSTFTFVHTNNSDCDYLFAFTRLFN